MELRWFRECCQICGDCVTGSDDIDCPELPYIKAMSVLRQATKGTSDALMDKLLLEFLTEADLELQNTSTKRSRQKLYIAVITALIDYLHIRNMSHAALSDFHTELINRASGFQVQFSFDAEVGRKSQTLEDATRQALVLAYYEAFPKDRSTTYKLAKKHLGLNRGQVVQRAADARKGTNKRSEIDNLRRWAEEIKERLSPVSQQRHAARQKARKELFLKGPVIFDWMCSHIPDATSRLILVARAFVDIEDSPRIKLTRKHWECAGITDKDARSRVITKIKRECPAILLDTQQGRCTYIEFKRL